MTDFSLTLDLLPWDFEAFRAYATYDVLLNAAAVFRQYEGEALDSSNPRMQEMQRLLELRTARYAWVPKRESSEDVLWDVEGIFYRNKGRLLTSLFVIEMRLGGGPALRLLPFGRALAAGKVNEKEFYDFIIRRYRYPHPAYKKNWVAWTEAERTLYPFAFMLQVLLELQDVEPGQAFLTSREVLRHLYVVSDHSAVASVAADVLEERRSGVVGTTVEVPSITSRKITDLMGFLCISGYAYYKRDGSMGLNLRSRHSVEKSYFEGSRVAPVEGASVKEDRLQDIRDLVDEIGR